MSKEEKIKVTGKVISENGKVRFTVETEEGLKIEAYPCGKMRKSYIKILVGDEVDVEVSPYDVRRGRITWRYK